MPERWKNPTAVLLADAGWDVQRTGGGHLVARCGQTHDGKKGCRIIMAATPSDHRGNANTLARARRNHPDLGRETHPIKHKETPMSGRKPGKNTTKSYEDIKTYLAAYPDVPFNGLALDEAGVSDYHNVLLRATQLSKMTLRLVDGGFRTSSVCQRYWDEIREVHGGGLIYRTPSPVTGATMGWYVFDTKAEQVGRRIVGNRWPVLGDNRKIKFPVATAPEPVWVEQDNGAFKQVDESEPLIPAEVDVIPVPESALPIAHVMARFNGGGPNGLTPDQMVLRVGDEILLVTVERTA